MMNAIYPLLLAATSGVCAVTSGAQAQNAVLSEQNSWLLGDLTQNAPCKVDRSNPVELKVRISTDKSSPRAAFAIGRLGEPVFLAFNDAGLITGTTLAANGGQYIT